MGLFTLADLSEGENEWGLEDGDERPKAARGPKRGDGGRELVLLLLLNK